jgi:beta-carotene 3-hydroxylase
MGTGTTVGSIRYVTDPFLAALVAFVVMEPATYAAHRWLMHGIGWTLHRSHHRRRIVRSWRDRWEANDWFPVMFAAVTVLAMAAGSTDSSLRVLLPVGVGVTAYGASYGFVHDVYIHRRFARLPLLAPLEYLRWAHGIHHLFGREPYGMLCPIVPRALRDRARTSPLEPLVPRRAPVG